MDQSTIATAANNGTLHNLFTDEACTRIKVYTANIQRSFLSATSEQFTAGEQWYGIARYEAQRIADETGITLDQACAVLAVLSPMAPWHIQCTRTIPFVNAVLGGEDARTITAPFLGENKAKAGAIIRGECVPIDGVTGVKVESFYRNICGHHDTATVDRHALRIALARDVTPEACNTLLRSSSKTRLEVLAAYHLAAVQLDYEVAVVQAIVWVVFRGKAD